MQARTAAHTVRVAQLEAVVAGVPAAVALLEGPEHRVVLANPECVLLVGGRTMLGRPVAEAFPELAAQGFVELLDRAYDSGEAYRATEARVLLERGGAAAPRELFLDFANLPMRDEEGAVWAILVHAVDVTEVVAARRTVEGLAAAEQRTARLLAASKDVLELVARGAPLGETLERLVRMVEAQADGAFVASVVLVDADGNHLRNGAAPGLPDAHSWSAPILSSAGNVLGTFVIDRREAREPDERERSLVEIATRTAAVAIELERLEEERQRHLRVVEGLNRVGHAVNEQLDLDAIVQVVTDAATELTGARFGAFFYNVVRPDGESLRLYALSGAPRAAFARFPQPRSTAIFGPTFRGERTMRIDDVLADPRYGRAGPYHGMPEGHLPVRSYLAVPVRSQGGEVLGGLFFGHEQVAVFTEEAERLAVGVAAQAAVAFERARLFDSEQQARAEAERRARSALSLEYVSDGVCLVDGDGVVRVWNPAAAAITGLSPAVAVGAPLDEALPGLPHEGSAPAVPVEAHGHVLWLAVTVASFPGGRVYTFRDRTDERRLERLRSEIVATVSHELRTPLAAVYGAARTLGRDNLALDAALHGRLVEMIVGETERLNRVVDRILLASELHQPARRSQDGETDAVAVARRVVELAQVRSGALRVELDAEEGVPPVHGDADTLQQVLSNLVDNAIKYGSSGDRVTVEVGRRGTRVRVAVADFGPGIPPQERNRVFDRFYRLDPEQRAGVGGTGLGLYISRELVRELGGRISVASTEAGRGATFVVELPVAAARGPVQPI